MFKFIRDKEDASSKVPTKPRIVMGMTSKSMADALIPDPTTSGVEKMVAKYTLGPEDFEDSVGYQKDKIADQLTKKRNERKDSGLGDG